MSKPYKYTYGEYENKLEDIKNNILNGSVDLNNVKDELNSLKLDFKNDSKKLSILLKNRSVGTGVDLEHLNNVSNEGFEEKIKLTEEMLDRKFKNIANERALEDTKAVNKGFLNFATENNYINFTGGGEMVKREETKEYNQDFFNYMMGKTFNNAMATTTSAGAVIPTTTFNGVLDNIRKQTGIISKVRVLNIPGKMVIPQSQIIEGATWHTEGEEIGDTTKAPKNITLSGYELAKLFSMSVATQSMSIKEFEQYLTIELGNAMSTTLNDAILHGTGTGQLTGIIKGTTWNGSNSKEYAEATVFSDLVQGMSLLSSNFRQNACWFLNSTTLYKILSKVDTNGNPIFTQGTSESPAMKLMGKEIVIDDYIEEDTILFGDASYYFLNFSSPVTITRSEDAGFTKASILYRAISVVDGKLAAPSFVKFTKLA